MYKIYLEELKSNLECLKGDMLEDEKLLHIEDKKIMDDIVNIESSLTLDKYISGHLVQGHVDIQAKIIQIDQMDTSWRLTLRLNNSLSKYIITKGSIAIDGISLTINEIKGNEFSVMIIPHTYKNTVIKTYKEGDNVNIEFDLLAKYIEKLGKAND
mgnify:CR=1 FL=1